MEPFLAGVSVRVNPWPGVLVCGELETRPAVDDTLLVFWVDAPREVAVSAPTAFVTSFR